MNRTVTLLALVLLAFAVLCAAQNIGTMPPGHMMLSSPDAFADGHLAALDKQVTLTGEQKPKVRAVFMAEAKELFAVFGDKTMTQEQKQERIQQIHLTTRNQVWNLLTHEQRKLMNEGPAPLRPVA
jgi:Spy/CpxP family protein refolding chaperone